jgi:spore germination protein GerM
MQDQRPHRRIPLGIIAGISVFVLTTGSAVALWTLKKHSPAPPPAPTAKTQPSEPEQTDSQTPRAPESPISSNTQNSQASSDLPTRTEKSPEVYWLKPSDKAIALAPSPAKPAVSKKSNAALEEAMNQLVAGPGGDSGETTTIPVGTKLRSVTQKADGIHVDLSEEFKAGGGTSSMTGRVAQILYTATSVDPNAPVWISVEGEPLETLGGEGLVLEQPITRDRFKKDFPSQQ